MTNEMIKSLVEQLNKGKHLSELGLSAYDFNEDMTVNDASEFIQERINEHEIIFYHHAIKYLSENDPSLRNSLALANEYGCEFVSLDSEKLATMLFQADASEELSVINYIIV